MSIGPVQLGPMRGREGHVGEHVGLDLVHKGGELGDLGSELIGDLAPLGGFASTSPSREHLRRSGAVRQPFRQSWVLLSDHVR
jgi:hypothetical protein